MADEAWTPQSEAGPKKKSNSSPASAHGSSSSSDKKYAKLNALLDKTNLYSKFLSSKLSSDDAAQGGKSDSAAQEETQRVKGERLAALGKAVAIDQLRDYQVDGVDWLIGLYENGLNGILADEMGLGKTVQIVAFIGYLMQHQVANPFLVVAPLSTLPNWINEFHKWLPGVEVQRYHGEKTERTQLRKAWGMGGKNKKNKKTKGSTNKNKITVVVTSYEIAINDAAFFKKVYWSHLVVDEGHRLKNMNCKLIQTLKLFPTESKLLLTGTPLQNNLTELWSLMNFILPAIFDSLERFQSWFDFDETSVENKENIENLIEKESKHQMVSKLHEILRPFVLRRIKSEVLRNLPSKREYVVYTPLTSVQEQYYRAVLAKEVIVTPDGGSGVTLRNMLMQLRKICNHPFLLAEEGKSEYDLEHNHTDETIVSHCGKMQMLDALLGKLWFDVKRKKDRHKVLIFSQMTKVLDVLADYLSWKGMDNYCRIDGNIPSEERQADIDRFQRDDDCGVFLLSTRAGGLGVNLTAADTVIIYDSDWNPQQDLQAQDRCHRFGQTEAVRVFRFITSNSCEIRMHARATSKRKLEELVIHQANLKGVGRSASKSELVKSHMARELMSLLDSERQDLEAKTQDSQSFSSASSPSPMSPMSPSSSFSAQKRKRSLGTEDTTGSSRMSSSSSSSSSSSRSPSKRQKTKTPSNVISHFTPEDFALLLDREDSSFLDASGQQEELLMVQGKIKEIKTTMGLSSIDGE